MAVFALLISGCGLLPEAEPPESAPQTPITDTASDAWEALAPGLERRVLATPEDPLAGLVAVRLDPALYDFRVHYRPGDPLAISEWRDTLPDAAMIINANFFSTELRALGLVISDGTAFGDPYRNRGGSFATNDSMPVLFSNTRPGIDFFAWRQLVQGFPMLVEGGQAAYTHPDRATRRTTIGIDRSGRVVVIVTSLLGLGLDSLSTVLAEPEYELVDVLNLDGGGSTMMWLRDADFLLPSRDPVPTVLAAYPRQ